MHVDNMTWQIACLQGLFATVLTLNFQQLVVFLVVFCPKWTSKLVQNWK